MNLAELLFDENIDRVLALDTSFKVIAWNRSCELTTGIAKSAILGKSIFDFFPDMQDDQDIVEGLNAALRGHKSFVPHGARAFQLQFVEHHFIPLKDDGGNVIGILNVLHDVAHRVKAENELSKLNEDLLRYQREIEQLNGELVIRNRQLTSLNSELKTFTNIAVNDYSETLRQLYLYFEYVAANEAEKLSNPGKANIRKAQAAIQKMKLLTSDIIAYTRLNEFGSDLQDIDLNDVVQTVVDDLQESIEAANMKLVVGQLPTIKGYSFLVSLLFYHLLQNAIRFRNEQVEPVVHISSGQALKGSEVGHEAAVPSRRYYVITVTDNGIGFEPEKAELIFQIFTRLQPEKHKGAGIGLAISKKAMELHEGFIIAEGNAGKGASFHCYFPVV